MISQVPPLQPCWQVACQRMQSSPMLQPLYSHFALHTQDEMPGLAWLNAVHPLTEAGLVFVDQHTFTHSDALYYEQIVVNMGQIPLRLHHWHDFFNALIWRQFPKTKLMLSSLHCEDIGKVGLSPRTPRRNQLTHWDECGLILAIESGHLSAILPIIEALCEHRWVEALWTHRAYWHGLIHPVLFGHASLEAMLAPFDTLTVKWLVVEVPTGFGGKPWQEQCDMLDDALLKQFARLEHFTLENILRPLPLCGVPGWWQGQDATFYGNTRVFRPARANRPSCAQLTWLREHAQ